jgi:hypothetical protein
MRASNAAAAGTAAAATDAAAAAGTAAAAAAAAAAGDEPSSKEVATGSAADMVEGSESILEGQTWMVLEYCDQGCLQVGAALRALLIVDCSAWLGNYRAVFEAAIVLQSH